MANPTPWLDTMRSIDGTKWAQGDGKNPTILSFLNFIGTTFPGMASYCASAATEDYFEWCGLAVGFCMAKAGIPPVFGTVDTAQFLFAEAWLGWGTLVPVTEVQQGDVVIFDFGSGHHVSLFEKDNGNGTWACHGGNQSHEVKISNFFKSNVMGVRRPIVTVPGAEVPIQPPIQVPVGAAQPPSERFNACVKLVLQDEGGNDDDPRDPGGRTSRGITQRDWNQWLLTHPTLPADVFQAPQDQIVAIYHDNYWNKLSGDDLPAGVDYVVFDYGVLSGISRSSKILQGLVGAKADGEIGPLTIAATAKVDPSTLINKLSDERLAFLQALPTFAVFGKGWTSRVQRCRAAALAMASAAAKAPVSAGSQASGKTTSPPDQQKTPSTTTGPSPAGGKQMTPDEIAQAILNIINAVARQQGAQPIDPAAIGNILQIVTTFLNSQQQGQQPVPTQDILQSVLAALAKQQGAPALLGATPTGATPGQAQAAPTGQDLLHLVLGTLLGKQLTLPQPAPGGQGPGMAAPITPAPTTVPPILTGIDKLVGGSTLAGNKTLIAILGFALQMVLQLSGAAPGIGIGTSTGNVIATLLGAFGGLGLVSKADRVVQLLGMIANAQNPPAPPATK